MSSRVAQVICLESFRRERQAEGARVLPYLQTPEQLAPRSPFGAVSLSDREVEHRQQMLHHLSHGKAARQAMGSRGTEP